VLSFLWFVINGSTPVFVLGNTTDVIYVKRAGRSELHERFQSARFGAAEPETRLLCELENWFHECFINSRIFPFCHYLAIEILPVFEIKGLVYCDCVGKL
jgi:hypothetical protein